MYKELPAKTNLPDLEKEILAFWQENKIFEKSIEQRDAEKPFVFYEGPPTANGRPGIHHVISRTVKDLVCRLKTMQGYRVRRKAGWDTHGLPVEIEVEKTLGLDGKEQVLEYGLAEFNAKCRESVWTYKQDWDELTRRMGYWIDLDHPYITYTNDYIETVWWIIKQFWLKGMVFLGHKILPYCPRCETPLSSHEVSQGYQDVQDPSIYVKAKVRDAENTYFLVWTTTPWTLISNVALAFNPAVKYVKVEHQNEFLILAEDRLGVLEEDYRIVETLNGADLENIGYVPFFDFIEPEKRAFYTILGDFVTVSDGSGIVHIAPAFGDDDYQMGVKYDLPVLQPVNHRGEFTDDITPWAGQFVKDADPEIIKNLKQRHVLYKTERIVHSYPHCWRCKTPLLYYARKSWYIRTTAFKENLIQNNKKIDWYPREVGEGRFGEWLENNIDWSLSRDRFWGTPLPIWICQSCGDEFCVGSIEELRNRGEAVSEEIDLHKPYVDEIELKCEKCNDKMVRVPEVIDCWFDSGSMPYAQLHYPFENKEAFDKNFPADFISEGVDQTRGWFYSLLAISTFLNDQPAYKRCLAHELILDKDGKKMSKSLGNTANPFDYFESHGADALRWYLLTVSPPWVPTRFDPDGVTEIVRKFFGTLSNTYSFFVMYANIDQFDYREEERIAVAERSELDRWLSSTLSNLVNRVNGYLERYDLTKAGRDISAFVIDDLSNWYVRRSRRRFWKSDIGADKLAAFQTLHECLMTVARLMAPFAPFFAEVLYRNLRKGNEKLPESVHLALYPKTGPAPIDFFDDLLQTQMDLARRIVNLGRSLRNEAAIKVRQPLANLLIVSKNEKRTNLIKSMDKLVMEELNVKNIKFVSEESELVSKNAQPNFKTLGPKVGEKMQKVAEKIRQLSEKDIDELEEKEYIAISIDDQSFSIHLDDVTISPENRSGLVAESESDLTVALETDISEELLFEGFAREFVNRVQNMRKEAGLQVTDRIHIYAETASEKLRRAIEAKQNYIQSETLGEALQIGKVKGDFIKDWTIGDDVVRIGITK
ncbi:isoleucine--tRNA ligase [candidate division KSB1 bacterium]|nr:isoleucine--tRNA ligase [candidate division KSB1 bacterium]